MVGSAPQYCTARTEAVGRSRPQYSIVASMGIASVRAHRVRKRHCWLQREVGSSDAMFLADRVCLRAPRAVAFSGVFGSDATTRGALRMCVCMSQVTRRGVRLQVQGHLLQVIPLLHVRVHAMQRARVILSDQGGGLGVAWDDLPISDRNSESGKTDATAPPPPGAGAAAPAPDAAAAWALAAV